MGSQILPSRCDALRETEAGTARRCWCGGTCDLGCNGACGWEAAKEGGAGGQFPVTAVGAGVAGWALSPRSLPVALGNESPKNHPGQLNPSPGMEVTDAARSHADPPRPPLIGEDGWAVGRAGDPCAPCPVVMGCPAPPCQPLHCHLAGSIIVPIPLWCTLLHTPL